MNAIKQTDGGFSELDLEKMAIYFAEAEIMNDGYYHDCSNPFCNGAEFIPTWSDAEFSKCPKCGQLDRI